MSGGRFNYMDMTLKNEIFGYTDTPSNIFEDIEISGLVWDVFNLIHDYDWYASGDTGKDTYLKAKNEFKSKWFGDKEKRTKEMIEKRIEEVKQELIETFSYISAAPVEEIAKETSTIGVAWMEARRRRRR